MLHKIRYYKTIFYLGLLIILVARITLAKPVASHSKTLSRYRNFEGNSLSTQVDDKSLLLARAGDNVVLPLIEADPNWVLDFYGYDWGYMPVATASYLLQSFYLHVLEFASTASDTATQRSLIRWGQLELEIMASRGSIGWPTVAHFAKIMLEATKRGYTNSYHCHMTNFDAGVWVTFNLYVHALR